MARRSTRRHGNPVRRCRASRLEAGLAALGQNLVMLGGFDTSIEAGLQITTEVDELDVDATNTWTTLPAAPVQWTHIQMVGIDGTLYLLGGLDGVDYIARGDSWALDPGADTWRSLASMPSGLERGAAGIVIAPPHVYLLGGAGTMGALSTCLDYDLLADTWTQMPVDLPAPRSHPAAMYRGDGAIIVIGGLSTLDATEPLATVLALTVGSDSWTPLASMPTARGGCGYGLVQGQLVCAGGEAGVAALHLVQSYDPNDDTWTSLPDMPSARAGAQGVAIGQRLFIPGGAQQLLYEPTDSLYVYSPL